MRLDAVSSWKKVAARAAVGATIAFFAVSRSPAYAETLEQALADAYLINPVLNAERARLRATDEQVALAKSGLRPFVSTSADYAFMNTDNDVSRPAGTTSVGNAFGISSAGGFPTGTSHPRGWSVQLTQPLTRNQFPSQSLR